MECGRLLGDPMETKRGVGPPEEKMLGCGGKGHLINTAEYLTSQSFIKCVVA